MSGTDLTAAVVLLVAYAATWILFLVSLRTVKIIQREKLTRLDQIRERLFRRKKTP